MNIFTFNFGIRRMFCMQVLIVGCISILNSTANLTSSCCNIAYLTTSLFFRDLYYLNNGQLKRGATKDTKNELLKSSLDSVSLYFDMLEKVSLTTSSY